MIIKFTCPYCEKERILDADWEMFYMIPWRCNCGAIGRIYREGNIEWESYVTTKYEKI